MAGTQVTLELTVACGYGDVGTRLTPNGVVRDWLLNMKYARVVEAASPARPAKLAARAAAKIAQATRTLV